MRGLCLFIGALTALAVYPASAPAQSGGSYVIAPATIAGGGATLSGGSFRLSGTIGQPATMPLSAASYRLYDGFWAPASTAPMDTVFVNGFEL